MKKRTIAAYIAGALAWVAATYYLPGTWIPLAFYVWLALPTIGALLLSTPQRTHWKRWAGLWAVSFLLRPAFTVAWFAAGWVVLMIWGNRD